MSDFERALKAIDEAIGWADITSQRTIREFDPPQAQRHCLLDGKRYMVALLPIDLESLDEIADTYERKQRDSGDERSQQPPGGRE